MSTENTTPAEHDVVRLKGIGDNATVVHVYPGNSGYLVEVPTNILRVFPEAIEKVVYRHGR